MTEDLVMPAAIKAELFEIKAGVIKALKEFPDEIYSASCGVEEARTRLEEAQRTLRSVGNKHLPNLDGKNAEIRKAQLAELTKEEEAAVWFAESEFRNRQLKLEHVNNRFRAYCYIARLLSSE